MHRKYTTEGRRNAILNMIHENEKVTVSDLVSTFGVSEVSIRKDLADLEEKHLLLRVKGGAINIIPAGDNGDLPISHKMGLNSEEKQAIGKYAASLIKDGETIFLDSGTTTMEIAKNLGDRSRLTVITNALDIALTLMTNDRITVIVLGGTIRPMSCSTVGVLAEVGLKNLFCDKLFLGVDSISIRNGISTPSIEEASLNQKMMASAKEIIAVFDSSKVNKRTFAYIAAVDEINSIITDDKVPADFKDAVESMGLKLHLAHLDK